MRFKPGQKVVCIHKGDWLCVAGFSAGKTVVFGPKYNEVVTVQEYGIMYPNSVVISEYTHREGRPVEYHEQWFEPLAEISEITEILECEPETVLK